MKNVILSADGDSIVYSVPDQVADNLNNYCIQFCDSWLRTSPNAKKYRAKGVICYSESDFIEYLNTWIFPDVPSKFIKNIGWINSIDSLPKEYRNCPLFNF